ncbi:MAG: hypothetical protein JRI80_00430 [Deltaproteobacteria bacterium]|nr:hypothetical protein [Deltaproteobacteria bacterium]
MPSRVGDEQYGYLIGFDACPGPEPPLYCDEDCPECTFRFDEELCAAGWPFADPDEEVAAKEAGTYHAIVDNFMHPREEQRRCGA